MSTIGLGNHGGIRKRIRANHAHPRAKLAALRLRLKLQSESLTECQKFDLIEDLIEYLNEINYGDFNESITRMRSLQRHFEINSL